MHGSRCLANCDAGHFRSSIVVPRAGRPSLVSLRDIYKCIVNEHDLFRKAFGIKRTPAHVSRQSCYQTQDTRSKFFRMRDIWEAQNHTVRVSMSIINAEVTEYIHIQPTLIFFERQRRQATLFRMCDDSPVGAARLPGVLDGTAEVPSRSMLRFLR